MTATMSAMALSAALVVAVGLFGCMVGSFLNVVINRIPAGEPVLRPGLRCRPCGTETFDRHHVPVLGWLVRRGRCADCTSPVSPRYPLVEAATGLLFVGVALRIVHVDKASALPAYFYFAAAGIALSVIDIGHKRLPNKIVLPCYPVLAILLTGAAATQHDWAALARAGIGSVALFAFYFLAALVYPAGMGFGDVKLAGVVGGMLAYLSWSALAVGAFGAIMLGAVAGLVVLASGGNRKTAIPFGPAMIAAAFTALFIAQPVVGAYLHLTQHG